jgi:hypothetical protein
MKNLWRTLSVLVAVIACLPPTVQALQRGGTVTGMVIDSADQPISGVLVFVVGGVSPVLTGAIGRFQIEIATAGTHVLNFRKAGLEPRTFRVPVTEDDGDAPQDVGVIRLEPGPEPVGTVAGRVTEAIGGLPVGGAVVELNGNLIAVTNANGVFNVPNVPLAWGPNEFNVRHLSYAEVNESVWLVNPNEVFAFDVVLIPVPLTVPEIVVDIDRTLLVYGRMKPFYERRASGLGFFFTRQEIIDRNPIMITDVLNGLPGVQLVTLGLTQVQVTFTRAGRGLSDPCPSPDLYFNGALVQGGFFLNDIIDPEQVEAMEIYRGTAETPQQFQKPGSTCGAIVIWTR